MPYALAAAKKGLPWVAQYFVGNMQNDPALRNQLPDQITQPLQQGLPQDPVALAYQAHTSGDPATATRLVAATRAPSPFPGAWEEFLDRAKADYEALTLTVEKVGKRETEVLARLDEVESDAQTRQTDVQTRTQQLLKLVEETTNASAQSFFDTEATRNENEGRVFWRWSVGLLALATAFAVAPIAIYYAGVALEKDWLNDQNLVAAHFAPAVALGAVAGVLLHGPAAAIVHARERRISPSLSARCSSTAGRLQIKISDRRSCATWDAR